MRRVLMACLGLVLTAGCGGGDGGPTTPAPPPQDTRIIHIDGGLDFGDVPVGGSSQRTLRVFNQGSGPMTITGLRVTNAAPFTASWTQGTIAPNNGSQDIVVTFRPTASQDYSGTFTVEGNFTSGIATKQVTARGVREPFSRSGSGNAVFDMPREQMRVRIFGRWDGRSTSNFIVRIGGQLVVNAILRDRNPYEGVHLVNGGTVEILQSEGITEWRFTEER